MLTSLNNEPCAILIHNLIVLRCQYGLTKKAMAKLLGISTYSLNVLEGGKIPSLLGVELLFRVQACFEITIRDLLSQRI